ncbi:MAG TPA: DUF3108 domain-containing protein [Methyloversatilis sp.]
MPDSITRSRLALALSVSLLLHLLLVGGLSSIGVEDEPAEEPDIRATLIAPPAQPDKPVADVPVASPRPPKPRRPKTPPTGQMVTEPAGDAADTPADSAESTQDTPQITSETAQDASTNGDDYGAEGPPPQPPDQTISPRLALIGEARIEYDVYRGENLQIGQARYHWVHDGAHYKMDTMMETTGLAGLLRPIRIDQSSAGDVDDAGIRPARYTSRSTQGKAIDEEVIFDRTTNRVMLRAGNTRSEYDLSASAQDMASMWLEIIWRSQTGEPFDFPLATGKRYTPRWFVPDADTSSLDTALGRLLVMHLRARSQPGDNKFEVWLAPNLRWLPVRIRYTDRKGDAYDLHARLVEYENQSLRAGSTASAAAPHTTGAPAPEPINPFLR